MIERSMRLDDYSG